MCLELAMPEFNYTFHILLTEDYSCRCFPTASRSSSDNRIVDDIVCIVSTGVNAYIQGPCSM